MKSIGMFAIGVLLLAVLAFPVGVLAGGRGGGSMSGGMGSGSMSGGMGSGSMSGGMGSGSMSGMHGEGMMDGHGMMMGNRVFEGAVGPFQGEVRLVDMKAWMEKEKASGMKMEGMMQGTHHLSLMLVDPKTKKAITGGTGTVTVIAPDRSESTTNFMVMQGHFSADVNLPAPGKYTIQVDVNAGGTQGNASFPYTVQ